MMMNSNETIRQLIEMSVKSGRNRQSRQSGLLHYCYQLRGEEPHLTIPLVENVLFALALLRSRYSENVIEAKGILERLLHFQNRQEGIAQGNFPVYLHAFPKCDDKFLGAHLAIPFYWMLNEFSHVLGSELKKRLETSFLDLLRYCLRIHRSEPAPYPIGVKIAAAAKAGGTLLLIKDLKQEGEALLESFRLHPDQTSWFSPASIAAILSALQAAYPSIKESPWNPFWLHLEQTWHHRTCSYIGPAFEVYQQDEEPQVTLYDLFLGYFSRVFSERALKDSVTHLEAALIRPSSDTLSIPPYPLKLEGNYGEAKWAFLQTEMFAYSFVEKGQHNDTRGEKGFHPLRIIWGNRQRVHTFVCQRKNGETIDFVPLSDGIDISFGIKSFIPSEEREKSKEITFYIDRNEGMNIDINGSSFTTFMLGEELQIKSGGALLSLAFHLEEGYGQFMGHLMMGNRPSHTNVENKQCFGAFDWQLFLRTVRRSDECRFKTAIRIKNMANAHS
jgi:hypothetical protein